LASGGENGHRKFAFIHIQKTGGSSVEELLRVTVPDITHYGPRHMGAGHARKTLEDWEERFTFAFVRNPWDRLVSWYSKIEGKRSLEARRVQGGEPPDEHWLWRIQRNPLLAHTVQLLEEDSSFESFVKRCVGEFRKNGAIYSFTRNQIDYLTTIRLQRRGSRLVDFVGRFERLSEDLAAVFSEIGLEPGLVEDTLPHTNQSDRGLYRDYYTPETAAIVAERFAKDIEYFGYEFDGEESVRMKVLAAIDRGMPRKSVAEIFGVPLPTIRRWLRQRKKAGRVGPKRIARSPARKSSSLKEWLPSQLKNNPDLTLQEHCEAFEENCGVSVSTSTMSQAIRELPGGRPLKKSAS
jgi:transposase